MTKKQTDLLGKILDPSPKDPHPKWGYDRDKVPGVLCFFCKEPIGEEKYLLDTILARFGTMMFVHERCVDPKRFTEP